MEIGVRPERERERERERRFLENRGIDRDIECLIVRYFILVGIFRLVYCWLSLLRSARIHQKKKKLKN